MIYMSYQDAALAWTAVTVVLAVLVASGMGR